VWCRSIHLFICSRGANSSKALKENKAATTTAATITRESETASTKVEVMGEGEDGEAE
jgi:hypothetical protein